MKKLLYTSIICILSFSSCKEEFLDLAPPTGLTDATYFKTETHFNQALVAAYERLRVVAYTGIYMDEMRSDNTFFTYYPGDRGPFLRDEVIPEFLDDQTTYSHVSNRYEAAYSGIARVNTITSKIEGANFPQEAKDRILGEALFLRAFYYFDLVTHFGPVALHLEEVRSESAAFLPRSPIEKVYDQIITDLTNAIPKLPDPSFPQTGRATKGAAKMLLAYVYMTKPQREYAKAEAELKDILTMGYELLPNYADVFKTTNKNSKESIFEVQFKEGDTGQQSDFIWRFIPKTVNTEAILGFKGNNYGFNSGGWNVPTQEMVDSYESGDLRLDASIAVAEGVKNGDNFTTEAVKNVAGYTPTPGKTYYYFIRKYLNPPYTREWNTNDNWPVYRYAGALLLLAECLVEQGKNGEALPYLNQVRNRAGLPDLAEATKENVADEMRHELAFENHRWTDLIRTGKAVEVVSQKGAALKSNTAEYGFLLPTSFNVTPDRLIYPIPLRELQINQNLLPQNPGY
jgi:starch-binding outer membrane protein, SusD/RagB family